MATIRVFSLSFFCFLLILGPNRAEAVSGYTFQQWGQESLAQIETDYRLTGSNNYLYAESLTNRSAAFAWPQGVMFSALAAAAKVDESYLSKVNLTANAFNNRYRCNARGYWAYNASAGSCSDRYYDDNAWIALAYMELYELTLSPVYLSRAQEILIFCMSGENGPGDTPNGGIRWHESNTSGASVCSTAPTILANLMVYQATGIDQYLTDGARLYHWLAASNLRYSSGIYHETNQGPLGYQTAVVLQAALRLYRITGDTGYLTEAQRLAAAMVTQFINYDTHALGQTGKWGGHDMTNAYVDLYEIDHNPYWLNIAAGYLEFLYNNCKYPATGRYPESWNNTTGSPSASLIDNASVARAYWKMASVRGGSAPVFTRVKNRSSQRCLLLNNSGTADNTTVLLYTESSTSTPQMWTLVDLGNGYYNIRSRHADKSLQPLNSLGADNTSAVIFTANADSYAQQWSLIDVGSGYLNIQNRLTGKSLQPLNSGTANNTAVITYTTDLSQQSQQWQFVGYSVPTSITPSLSVNGRDWMQIDRAFLNIGDTLLLKGQAPGSGTWRWTGPKGFSASGPEVLISNIQIKQAGRYTVTYTNGNGIESFTAINITVPAAVKLYQNCDYTGWKAEFGAGAYTSADLVSAGGLNNDASAVRIEPGHLVTFYDNDNFQGPTLVKTADVTCLVSDGWNDRVTSMIIAAMPDPVMHLPLNDNGGSTAADVSPYGRHGVLVNMDAGSWTIGKQCGGLTFDGVNDYVKITGLKGIRDGLSRTCTAWIKTTKAPGEIISWGNTVTERKWIIRVNETGSLRAEVQGGYLYGTTTLNDGKWHHIAVVLENDGTPNIADAVLYVDGLRDTPAAVVPCTVNTADTLDVSLGVFTPAPRYFQGQMDEVRVYRRALSDAEIGQMYQANALTSDIKSDGIVDFADFSSLAAAWQTQNAGAADLTCDGIVNMDDMAILAEEWLNSIR